jgi:hypothetical protein
MRPLLFRVIPHQVQGTPPTEFQFTQYGVWLPFGHREHPLGEVTYQVRVCGGSDKLSRAYALASIEGDEAYQLASLRSGSLTPMRWESADIKASAEFFRK